ncbi:MAG: ribose-phosphate pyrophosphokinase [Spirochaetes bacterium]|nr:ribose-phosphate pyrophosphokinase [Spirochaetota bacterium]
MLNYDIRVFSGSSNRPLAEKIASELDLTLGEMELSRFADNECFVQVKESVRNKDAFVIQSTSNPGNEHWMEMYLIIDALRRASAKRITAVIPYYGYSRQDRKHIPRVAISAKLVANLLTTTGVDRVLAMDLHAAQLQGYFDIPVDHLTAVSVFIKRFKALDLSKIMIISPDIGGVVRARKFASYLNLDIAIIDKRRPKANVSEVMHIIGDVAGKDGVIIDDIIDTGGTIVKAVEALKKAGMGKIYVAATHGVFSNDALKRLNDSGAERIFVGDSIQVKGVEQYPKIEVLSLAPLFAEGIRRIHKEESVSSLFLE